LHSIVFGNEPKYLQVYGFSDGIYNQQDRSTYIHLSTTTTATPNDTWKDIQIPDIDKILKDSKKHISSYRTT
jgi:hypothetical protein